jgi:hypothetical protein
MNARLSTATDGGHVPKGTYFYAVQLTWATGKTTRKGHFQVK